jgi:fatty-acyl-CoA synthase
MSLAQRLASYDTLLDAIIAAPPDSPVASAVRPGHEPEETSANFGQFLAHAYGYARLYEEHGLRAGDVVVIVMPQGIAQMAAFTGALVAGMVPTILAYPTFKVDPEKYRTGLTGVTRNLRAALVVFDREIPEELAARIEGSQVLPVDTVSLPSEASYEIRGRASRESVAFIQHSAGTTGLQKGVALSHGAVLTQLTHLAEALALRPDDRIASWLPLYHDMGLIACFILPLAAHLPVAMQSPTDWVLQPVSFLRLVTRHRSTLCWLPNFAFQFMARRVREEERAGLDLSSLRAAINCSEPVRAQSMTEFFEAYRGHGLARAALQTSYAMAENTFAVTQSVLDGSALPRTVNVDRNALRTCAAASIVPADHPDSQTLVSSGVCLAGNRVRVVDDAGQDVADGAIGEILVQSDSLFSGYCNRPDLTALALYDGWYRTRDRGMKLGPELFVLGRKDDLIIVAGRNIHPLDIEEIAWRNVHIREGRVIAFGVENPDLGTQDLYVIAEVGDVAHLEVGSDIQLDIRTRIMSEIGVAPRVVHLVPPQWIVKSTAGKPARSASQQKFFRENPELDPTGEQRTG